MSTWNPGAPNADQSPSLFPPQCTGNWSRLQTVVGSDHQFNTSDAANDGWHNIAHMQPVTNSAVNNACGQLFADATTPNGNLTYIDQANNRYTLTPPVTGVAPILAAANFVPASSINGPATILFSQNISSITTTAYSASGGGFAATYVVSFNPATPLPSAFYCTSTTVLTPFPGGLQGICISSQSNSGFTIKVSAISLTSFQGISFTCVGG